MLLAVRRQGEIFCVRMCGRADFVDWMKGGNNPEVTGKTTENYGVRV